MQTNWSIPISVTATRQRMRGTEFRNNSKKEREDIMATNTELIKRECADIAISPTGGIQCCSVGQCFGFAQLMERGSMLPKGMTVEGATVAIVAGASLGLNPFQAVQGIACINGRPSLWGDARVALVRGSGLLEDEKVEYLPNIKDCQGVRVVVKRKGVATPAEGFFSKAMAEKAGLWGKPGPWSTHPIRMLLNRARGNVYRDVFADVLKGIRSAEEEQDIRDHGYVVDADPMPMPAVEEAAPEKPRKRTAAGAFVGAPDPATPETPPVVEQEEVVTELPDLV